MFVNSQTPMDRTEEDGLRSNGGYFLATLQLVARIGYVAVGSNKKLSMIGHCCKI
jgi:hypothetical protein